MSIFVDEDTKLLVQGITGREAREKVPEMLDYGTDVVAGVTPGKEGEEVHGVPVYDSVEDALEQHPEINASLVYVPARFAKDAAFEAIEAGIPLLNIVTENIPVKDTWKIVRKAEENNSRVVGPTSVGIISPGKTKVGPIGGDSPEEMYEEGRVGIVSKSGGMTTETAHVLKQSGLGVSTAVDIGGDIIPGTSFREALELFEEDDKTDAVVIFGELGGKAEIQAAEFIEENMSKPVYGFIAGEFTENLPSKKYGHAGAIIRGKEEQPSYKKKRLREAGAEIVDIHHKLGEKIRSDLGPEDSNQ
jgi:succinyl-CoA synthetase alpha subunit